MEALLSPAAESVVVFSGLGVQLESRGHLGGVRREFLELEQIEAAVINEGVTATAVLPYLCFLVRGSERLSVAFPDLRPGVSLKVLREVRLGGLGGAPLRPQCARSRRVRGLSASVRVRALFKI